MEAVATRRRRTDAPVAQRLLDPEEAPRFDFLQAVRLLELVHRQRARAVRDAGGVPADRTLAGSELSAAVRFSSRVSLGFPASDLAWVRAPAEEGGPFRVGVDFMGLAGLTGPLPRPLTELVIERGARGDGAAQAFLDVFNHRLVELLYAARKKHRPALATDRPEETRVAQPLLALAGLGTRGLRGRMEARGVPDRALLTYAGLLAQRPRSMLGLETLLEDYFGVRVRGHPFRGRWLALEPADCTRIGASAGCANTLGGDAVLGTRMWDQQAAFELEIGPLDEARLRDFLPTGSAYPPLCELVRFWVGIELEFTLRLVVEKEAVPPTRLAAGTRLGWTSWLKTRETPADDRQLVLDEGETVPGTTPAREARVFRVVGGADME
jgi:type VI secretion system protein ImpH